MSHYIRALVCSLWCALLIVPILNNTLHYVIIEHHFGQRSDKLEYVDSKSIHYCEQYLCKLSPLIAHSAITLERWIERQSDDLIVEVFTSYKECLITFYWLRGPPWN